MLVFWGDGSQQAKDLVSQIQVRSTENFNWTFIFILAVVFYVYWTEINNKNYDAVFAGLALYGVHWLYEIGNAVIGHIAGYPLWSGRSGRRSVPHKAKGNHQRLQPPHR